MVTTNQTFYTSGTSFVAPNDWNNANNIIECIGGGGGGGGATGPYYAAGGGGGGGAYAKIVNFTLTPGATVYISIGAAGSASLGSDGGTGGSTWLNKQANAAPTSTANGVLAKGGTGGGRGQDFNLGNSYGAGGPGGATGSCIGSTTYKGGDGKAGDTGRSGGGAAGMYGAGGDASIDGNGSEYGGQGDAAHGGAGGFQSYVSQGTNWAGAAGNEWITGKGSGGGGAGSTAYYEPSTYGATAAGNYGGGGGAGFTDSPYSGAPTAGKQGLLVVTYLPSPPSTFIPGPSFAGF